MLGGLAALTLLALLLLLMRRRQTSGARSAISAVSITSLRDVILPDDMDGYIYIDHVLLTCRGIVVVDVKEYMGNVFASDRMEEWTVIGPNGRFAFPNPQGMLLDRIAAVRRLVRGIPVEGYILFGNGADFSKGRPKHVILAEEFLNVYKKPPPAELETLATAFSPHWSRLKELAQPADKAVTA